MDFAIDIQHVTKRYRQKSFLGVLKSNLALDDVSLQVPKGEIFGFLGPNGAGKTTLIKILVGILAADKGECKILGLDSTKREAKLKLGYLPERPYFHDFLTAREFLRFHGRLVGMEEADIVARIPKLLEKVGLKKNEDQRLRTFSKGMLQRVGFAQALIHDPEVLILDEPMSGLDPVGRREVRDIISEIALSGKTIFFSTHIIHDVEVICSSVAYIHSGKLKGMGNIEELLGKTVKSMELRFALPSGESAQSTQILSGAKKTMDGWALHIEANVDRLEAEVNEIISVIQSKKGTIRSVVPRKSTLEELFFGET